MKISTAMFYIKNYVDRNINSVNLNMDKIYSNFEVAISNLPNDDFCNILLFSGFIPDLYSNDSKEETLYSKLVEIVVSVWAKKLNLHSDYVKQKASYEDINIKINNKIIVCDAKSFRLGRSQKAPNVKDFLKLEDIRKWLSRFNNRLGGLITYPDTHEWTSGSDAYQYCSTKNAPTVMLPYKYLSLILFYKNNFEINKLSELWDYDLLFPTPLLKKDNNKTKYWNKIDSTLLNILNIERHDFDLYIENCNKLMRIYIKTNLRLLQFENDKRIKAIKNEIEEKNYEELKQLYIKDKIYFETKQILDLIARIKNFRL